MQGSLTFETTDEILKSELLISVYCLTAMQGGLGHKGKIRKCDQSMEAIY